MKVKKKKIDKGMCGYINNKKIKNLCITLMLLFIVLVMFYTGVIISGNTKNIFTVFAAVSAIPAAKMAVAYIVMIKYKSSDEQVYKKLVIYESLSVLADLLITSEEKIIHIDFAVVRDNSLYMYISEKNTDIKYAEKYVKQFLGKECKITVIKAFTDIQQFIKAAENLNTNNEGKYDKRIETLLKVYSM